MCFECSVERQRGREAGRHSDREAEMVTKGPGEKGRQQNIYDCPRPVPPVPAAAVATPCSRYMSAALAAAGAAVRAEGRAVAQGRARKAGQAAAGSIRCSKQGPVRLLVANPYPVAR